MSSNAFARLRRSVHGNGGVAPVTPAGPHRPARCRDGDCQRLLCRGYKDGYQDAWDEAEGLIAAAYAEGFANGVASASKD